MTLSSRCFWEKTLKMAARTTNCNSFRVSSLNQKWFLKNLANSVEPSPRQYRAKFDICCTADIDKCVESIDEESERIMMCSGPCGDVGRRTEMIRPRPINGRGNRSVIQSAPEQGSVSDPARQIGGWVSYNVRYTNTLRPGSTMTLRLETGAA